MRIDRLVLVVMAAVVAMLSTSGSAPGAPRSTDRFVVTALPPVSGPLSSGSSVNNRGQVAGFSSASDGAIHATVWRGGMAHDLGALGGSGASSAVLWPNKNNRGVVVGVSQTDVPDPNDEPWSCSAFLPDRPGYACLGFVWHDGDMTPLPTLGGTNSFAAGINNRNQIVGWAETDVADQTCTDGQVLGFLAVRWDRLGQRTTKLRPLAGDTASSATAINDRGRVVGISGICDQAVGRLSARKAVVWTHGKPRPLPDLGGIAWNTPMSLNERGDVVGFLNRSAADGASLRPLPVWWTSSGSLHQL